MRTGPRSWDWIERVIAANTVSANSNLPFLEDVADRLDDAGLVTVIRPNPEGDKANLVATMPAASGATEGGLVLSGHTDVVPVEGQDWSSDPFIATIRDGRIYGRGTSDMKTFVAVALAAVPTMKEARLKEPIHFALSYDEEVGLYGGAQMVDDFRALGLNPTRCIVGEPSGMDVIGAHKSICLGSITVRGRSGHSSRAPLLVNAAFHAARVITFFQELAQEFRDQGPYEDGYAVPFTTVSVDYVSAGNFSTTVPACCDIQFDFRTIAEVELQSVVDRIAARVREVEAEMQRHDPATGIDLNVRSLVPGLAERPEDHLPKMLEAAGAPAGIKKVAFGSEAGYFQLAGMETVVCGPGHIEQAHIADEYVSLEQVEWCENVLDSLIKSLGDT